MYIRVVLLAVEVGLSGRFLGGKRALLLRLKTPIWEFKHADISLRRKGFVNGWGSYPKKSCGFGLPFVSHELVEGSLIHGCASVVDEVDINHLLIFNQYRWFLLIFNHWFKFAP